VLRIVCVVIVMSTNRLGWIYQQQMILKGSQTLLTLYLMVIKIPFQIDLVMRKLI